MPQRAGDQLAQLSRGFEIHQTWAPRPDAQRTWAQVALLPGGVLIFDNFDAETISKDLAKPLRASTAEPRRSHHAILLCAVYCDGRHRMATESLADVVRSLTPQEQDAVRQFIDYLKRRDASGRSQSPFFQAAEEFIAQHPELLQRLAQ